MKILAIDYGEKNIGLAISDELEIVASSLPMVRAKNQGRAIEALSLVVESLNPGKIVLGMPSQGKVREKIEDFKVALEKATHKSVITWNEDFTSVDAERGTSIKFKHEKSHSRAAMIILQSYLDTNS